MLVAPQKIGDALREGSGHMLFHSPSGGVSGDLDLQETNENINTAPSHIPKKTNEQSSTTLSKRTR